MQARRRANKIFHGGIIESAPIERVRIAMPPKKGHAASVTLLGAGVWVFVGVGGVWPLRLVVPPGAARQNLYCGDCSVRGNAWNAKQAGEGPVCTNIMLQRATSRSIATTAVASRCWWEVARLATVDPELHKSLGSSAAPTMRILLADEERLGHPPAKYRGMLWNNTLRVAQEAYSCLKPPRLGCEAQTINETLTWGTVTKVTAFAVDVDMRYHDAPLEGAHTPMHTAGEIEEGVPIKDITTGAPVARMAVRGSMADLRKAIERCWPAHVEEGPRFLVAGREFEVGEYSPAAIFARAPIQPARDAMPDGVAIGFVLSAFEVEVNGERTPVYVHPDDATHLQAPGRPLVAVSANPYNDGGLTKVLFAVGFGFIAYLGYMKVKHGNDPKQWPRLNLGGLEDYLPLGGQRK